MARSPRRSTQSAEQSPRGAADYATSVFINCPFDRKYEKLFDAIIFAILDCGFSARCALELENGAQIRIDRIAGIISNCRLAVHDLSRTQLDNKTRLPQFNMPLELGMFLGAHRFGSGRHREKVCLILDTERYRYQKFISDIAGQDIREHNNSSLVLITAIRNWLFSHSKNISIPGGSKIHSRFKAYEAELPAICKARHWQRSELTFREKTYLMSAWTKRLPL